MNLTGRHLFNAVAYIAGMRIGSSEFEIVAKSLLDAPVECWARMLTTLRLAYRAETAEYGTATAIECILRGIESAA